MNRTMMLRIADAIDAHPDHFALDYFFGRRVESGTILPDDHSSDLDELASDRTTDDLITGCGTTACIAGWAILFAHDDGTKLTNWINYGVAGRHLLGITSDEAAKLFYPDWWWDAVLRQLRDQPVERDSTPTAKEAAFVLRALAYGWLSFDDHHNERIDLP